MVSREKIPKSVTARSRHYDRESGQVFSEWTIAPATLSRTEDWDRVLRVPARTSVESRIKGPRSLVEIALRIVAENFGYVEDVAWLQDLPDTIVWRIWHYFDLRRRPINFHAWKILVKRLSGAKHPEQDSTPFKMQHYSQQIIKPGPSLELYIKPMTSASFNFIAHLSLAGGATFRVTELLCLSSLKNLGVLEIIQPPNADEIVDFPRVSDRVVRAWSETPNPFPSLRILRIWGDDFTTSKSLEYVTSFPALAVYDVAGRKEDWRKSDLVKHEWDHSENLWRKRELCRTLMSCLGSLGGPENPHGDAIFYKLFEEAIGSEKQNTTYVSKDKIPKTLGPLELLGPNSSEDPSYSPVGLEGSAGATPLVHHPLPTLLQSSVSNEQSSITDFDTWGIIAYSQIGKLWRDQDLRAQGLSIDRVPVIKDWFIVPSLPYASLCLGKAVPRNVYNQVPNLFDRHWTLTRDLPPAVASETKSRKRAVSSTAASARAQPKKTKNFGDLLAQFSA